MQKLTQKGFGVIEGILIIVALSMIAGTGFYVINASKDKNEDSSSVSSQKNDPKPETDTTNEVVASQKYLTVSEWGIKIPLNDQVDGLAYTKQNGNIVFAFRSKILDNITKDCTASTVIIERGKALDKYIGEIGEAGSFKETYDAMMSENSPRFKKQLNDYYYLAGPPGGSCTSSQQDPQATKETEAISAINTALNTMIAL